MKAVVEQDGGHVSGHIEALEFLIRQQKDFIEQSAATWRGLLEQERASAEQGWRERDELDQRFRALSEEQMAHAHEVAGLQAQVDESRRQLQAAEQAMKLESESRVVTHVQSDVRQSSSEDDRLVDMGEELVRLENVLRQRQEEIEQAWAELGVHREKVAALEAELNAAVEREAKLQQKLDDANSWVFKLAGERTEREKQLDMLTRERQDMAAELAAAHRQMAALRQRIDLLIVNAAPHVASADQAQIIDDRNPIRDRAAQTPKIPSEADKADTKNGNQAILVAQALKANPTPNVATPDAIDSLMQPVAQRDKRLLLQKLGASSSNMAGNPVLAAAAVPTSMAASFLPRAPISHQAVRPSEPSQEIADAKSNAPTPVAMPMAVSSRNPQLERQLKAAEAQVQWLRAVSLAALEKPRKWTFLPLSWHLPRMAARFRRKALFDDAAYLSRYPDVAESGMDPLIHYILHGMDEGRER